ncbi:MAG: maleylpyruvate isomerase N-terminal domain-containing protein, partial [Maribacter sp.]|nr:maleylpyruvate isomerase N-terminal domain-containing protein [Maribacter sp.]
MENNLKELQYPIGHFKYPKQVTRGIIADWIKILEELPITLGNLVKHLSDDQLETPYRPGGWTVKQLVHHIADSHHHSYTRFKWALTVNQPLI